MLFLSGFEPYSRWVPLLSTVLSVLLIKIKIKIKIKFKLKLKLQLQLQLQLKLSNNNDDGSQKTGLLNK